MTLKSAPIVFFVLFSFSVWAQNFSINEKHFFVPNTSIEVSINNKTYQIIRDGKVREFPIKNEIQLKDISFDPLVVSPEAFIPKQLQQNVSIPDGYKILKSGVENEMTYIVQFKTQAFEGYQEAIKKLGGKVYMSIADHGLIISLTQDQKNQVQNFPFVRWIGIYHPAFKLEPALRNLINLKQEGKTRYSILLLDKKLQNNVINFIREIGGSVDVKTQSSRFEASLNSDQLLALANQKDILYVDVWMPSGDDMDVVRQSQGVDYIENLENYTGQGVNGEVMDDGLLLNHIDFRANIPTIHGQNDDDNDHGTCVYGILFGMGLGDNRAKGILPDAKRPIFSSRYHFTDRYEHTSELVDPDGPYRVVFQSNSWGTGLTNDYNTVSAELDQIAFDHDLLILQSQSNEGNQLSRAQAWSKNVVSIGGIRHYNTISRTDDAWVNTASIGPASDGRIKPDLINFYDNVLAPSSDMAYRQFSGTSSATPITAGHFGLLFQMWAEGVFEGNPDLHRNVFDSRPHMTTAKAMMINMAYQYDFSGTDHDRTRMHQGWGLPDIKNIYEHAKMQNWGLGLIIDESDVLGQLEENTYEIYVDGKMPLKITLVYADPMGYPGAQKQLINDLSLKVIDPEGNYYWGNFGLNSGNWSLTEGSADHLNNVENVFVEHPMEGNWQIKVVAEEIVTDAHLETEEIDADYALVVSGNKCDISVQKFEINTELQSGDSLIFDPPGGKYRLGTSVVAIPLPQNGYQFLKWDGDFQGSANPLIITMERDVNLVPVFIKSDSSIGNRSKFSSFTTTPNRRAMPFIANRQGKITKLSMYHNGGTGRMILGVYEGDSQTPTGLLGSTEVTYVSPNDDWQTIDLKTPVMVENGEQVWLSWVYEDNPGIYYEDGEPGRAESGFPWSYGMPENWGDTAKISSSVYSIHANLIPADTLVARILVPQRGIINETIEFCSDSSVDPLGTIELFEWDFGDAASSLEANPTHIYTTPGSYKVSLKITNNFGATYTTASEILITAQNQMPTAKSNGPYLGEVGQSVSFSKAGSFDPDGRIIAYSWSFGDDSNSMITNPKHTYEHAGIYEVILSVFDQNGGIVSDTTFATISDYTFTHHIIDDKIDGIKFYPNPVRKSPLKIVFPFKNEGWNIQLMNLEGKILKAYYCVDQEIMLDLKDLQNGIYIISIQTKEKVYTSKIMVLK